MNLPPCPPHLKSIQHYLKLAQEHDERDVVVSYWARLYALQLGLKLSSQAGAEKDLLLVLMDWLEATKSNHTDNEAIMNEVVAQAHLENYALKLFLYADKNDRNANFGKNVVKGFYTCGMVYDILQTFGELTEEATQNRKYAKWKAAYIHNCLKNGEVPVPGPMPEADEHSTEDNDEASTENNLVTPPPEPVGDADSNEGPTNPSPSHITPPTVEEVLKNPSKLPSPPVEEEKPGGFVPYEPTAQPNPAVPLPAPIADIQITPDQMIKAQKYCKYAGSALNYDDVKTAVENLRKALTLLTIGQDE